MPTWRPSPLWVMTSVRWRPTHSASHSPAVVVVASICSCLWFEATKDVGWGSENRNTCRLYTKKKLKKKCQIHNGVVQIMVNVLYFKYPFTLVQAVMGNLPIRIQYTIQMHLLGLFWDTSILHNDTLMLEWRFCRFGMNPIIVGSLEWISWGAAASMCAHYHIVSRNFIAWMYTSPDMETMNERINTQWHFLGNWKSLVQHCDAALVGVKA